MTIAGLDGLPGLTAGSLRLWSITKDVTDIETAAHAARRGGLTMMGLHHKLERLRELTV